MQEEEGAVSSECRLHVLWVQEPPAPPGGEALRGLRQLPWQWHPAPGLLAPGPPEEEEEEAQHHGPWKETEMTEELSPRRSRNSTPRAAHALLTPPLKHNSLIKKSSYCSLSYGLFVTKESTGINPALHGLKNGVELDCITCYADVEMNLMQNFCQVISQSWF